MVWLRLFILLLALPHARGGYSDGNYAEPECWVDTVLQPDCAILGDVLPRWDPAMPLEWTVDEPTSLQFWLDGEDPRHVGSAALRRPEGRLKALKLEVKLESET